MNTTKPMPLTVANRLIRDADTLFERAARAWVRDTNSGNNDMMRRCNKQCDDYRRKAEALLAPLGIEVDYPGLYPSFKVNGFEEHSTEQAVSSALQIKAGAQ